MSPLVTTHATQPATQEDRFAMAMRSLITAYRKGCGYDVERTAGWFQVGPGRLGRTFDSWVTAENASGAEEGASA